MNRIRLSATLAAIAFSAACSTDPTGPTGGALEPGVSITITGAANSEKVFTITVPEGTGTLQVRLSEGLGDADLIVRYGARPEIGLFDCASETDGNDEECLIDAPAAGIYYVLVFGYGNYADVRLLGSLLPQSGATPLTSGVAVTNLSGGAGSFRMYSIEVPAGAATLNVTLDAEGDADLYLRRAALPLLNRYDCASFTPTGSETCNVNVPQAGTWYIRVDGFDPYAAGTLTATVTLSPP